MLLSQILIISVNNFLFFKAWIKFNVDKRHIYFPTITQLSIESPHKNNSQLDSPSIEHYPINHLLRSLPSETKKKQLSDYYPKKKKTIIWLGNVLREFCDTPNWNLSVSALFFIVPIAFVYLSYGIYL